MQQRKIVCNKLTNIRIPRPVSLVYRTTALRWVSTRPKRPSGRPSRCGRASPHFVSGKSPTVTYETRSRSLQTSCSSSPRVSMGTAAHLMERGASWHMPISPAMVSVGTPTLMRLSHGQLGTMICMVSLWWIYVEADILIHEGNFFSMMITLKPMMPKCWEVLCMFGVSRNLNSVVGKTHAATCPVLRHYNQGS